VSKKFDPRRIGVGDTVTVRYVAAAGDNVGENPAEVTVLLGRVFRIEHDEFGMDIYHVDLTVPLMGKLVYGTYQEGDRTYLYVTTDPVIVTEYLQISLIPHVITAIVTERRPRDDA
jgi:hypothetical protein